MRIRNREKLGGDEPVDNERETRMPGVLELKDEASFIIIDETSSVENYMFNIKESGKREHFESGMVRDAGGDKVRYNRCLEGPMFQRWAEHLHKGVKKYPDISPGVANWTLANGEEELQRFKESALSHMIDWLLGKVDEDHAAGVFFNINGAEYVKEVIRGKDKRDEKTDTPGERGC